MSSPQPMQMRMAETITGTRGSVALKIFGEDLNTLEQLGQQAHHLVGKGSVGDSERVDFRRGGASR
jgi:heavy metal efflux system protein